MDRVRTFFPAAMLAIALLTACGGEALHINREYRMPSSASSVLALFPTDFHLQTTDDAFQTSFTKFASFKQVLSPGEVRKRQRIGAQVHDALRRGGDTAPLKVVLTDAHYSYLVTSLAPANLILFPIEVKLTRSGRYTYGNFSYRLYDLKSGILLSKSSFELKTGSNGMQAEISLVSQATDRMAREVMAALASR